MRLAAQSKMGYYPTPQEVVTTIKSCLKISKGARLIDTCCGEGTALSMLAEGSSAITYGVELDRERYEEAKKKLDHVLWADSISEFVCTKEAFSLLFLNPPYDSDEETQERMELTFLKKHFPLLQEGGVLILIVPMRAVSACLRYLTKRTWNISVFRFPDGLFSTFRQFVIIAEKRRIAGEKIQVNRTLTEQITAKIEKNMIALIDELEEETVSVSFTVPEPVCELNTFRSLRLDPDEAVKTVKKSPLWKQVKELLFSAKQTETIRPIFPLREGHLAMLLASGRMNGEITGRERLIIKGSVVSVRERFEEETEEERKVITSNRYRITVRAIRFSPEPEIITIQ